MYIGFFKYSPSLWILFSVSQPLIPSVCLSFQSEVHPSFYLFSGVKSRGWKILNIELSGSYAKDGRDMSSTAGFDTKRKRVACEQRWQKKPWLFRRETGAKAWASRSRLVKSERQHLHKPQRKRWVSPFSWVFLQQQQQWKPNPPFCFLLGEKDCSAFSMVFSSFWVPQPDKRSFLSSVLTKLSEPACHPEGVTALLH